MKKISILILVALILGCAGGVPVLNLQNEKIPSAENGKHFSVSQVENAILTATKKRGWNSRLVKPGLIEADITVRSHSASIEIPYSSTSYSINYKSSKNLDYDDGNIHKNYNKWIVQLSKSIQDQLGVKTQKF